MLKLLLSIIILVSNSAFAEIQKKELWPLNTTSTDGTDVGNGGFIVAYNNKLTFYDLFILPEEMQTGILFQASTTQDAYELAIQAAENIAPLDEKFAQALSQNILCFEKRDITKLIAWNTDGAFREKIGYKQVDVQAPLDLSHLPLGAKLIPAVQFVAMPTVMTYPNELPKADLRTTEILSYNKQLAHCKNQSFVYFQNRNVVTELDTINLAALIIHEAAWATLIDYGILLEPTHEIFDLTHFIYTLPKTINSTKSENNKFKSKLDTIIKNINKQ